MKVTIMETDDNGTTFYYLPPNLPETATSSILPEITTPTASASATLGDRRKSRRIKRRKLFNDKESDIVDIKVLLKKNDAETRTSNGARIIEIVDKRQPLPVSLRKKLVSISCQALMQKTNSSRPSTDQRDQLANCIVEQVFDYMTSEEKYDMKLSYYTPSSTYKDNSGKTISKRPMGYIQSWFVNFWQANKPIKEPMEQMEVKDEDEGTHEDILQTQDWLKHNRAPPSKVFEKLNQTMHTRKKFIRQTKEMSSIISAWPRLFDIDGAIQNDFAFFHPLAMDNLFLKWTGIAPKLMAYGAQMKRSVVSLGILEDSATSNTEVAAIFMLAFLIRPKTRKVTQINSVEAFVKVFEQIDIDRWLMDKDSIHPQVVAVGCKAELNFTDFFVLFQGKSMMCSSLLEALDLAFKSYYVLNVEFPGTCYGAYQFLDYVIYKMKPVCPVQSIVNELAAYVAKD